MSRRAWLVTEMIVARAVLERGADEYVRHDRGQSPILLQLGTGEPCEGAQAAKRACRLTPYDGININAGCPSSRVQGGHFGACLMHEPARVAAIVRAVADAVGRPVSVKCRLGLDDNPGEEDLDRFVETLVEAGCATLFVHARNAWLQGLDPRRNRSLPPLRWERVFRLKEKFPNLTVVLNGGITDLESGQTLLENVDGVMLGRAVDSRPEILADVDRLFYGDCASERSSGRDLLDRYAEYVVAQSEEGVPASLLYAPLLRLGYGCRGARRWRQTVVGEVSRLGRNPGEGFVSASLERLRALWTTLVPQEAGDGGEPVEGLRAC